MLLLVLVLRRRAAAVDSKLYSDCVFHIPLNRARNENVFFLFFSVYSANITDLVC